MTLLNQLMTAQIHVDKLDIDTREVAALNPSPTGVGEGGRRPDEGRRAETKTKRH